MWFPQPGRNFFAFANEVVKQLVAKHMKRANDSGLSQNRVGGEPFLISLEQLPLALARVVMFQLFDQAECGCSGCFLVYRLCPSDAHTGEGYASTPPWGSGLL
jgi:hypothetical protein